METLKITKEGIHSQKQEPQWGLLRKNFFIACIIFICAIGFFATDIYLPSLPAIGEYFKKDAAYVQLTMSVF